MFGKAVVLKVLKNSQKNIFSRILFKQFDISNIPPINTLKTESIVNIASECSENLQNLQKCLLWNHFFIKVIGEFSVLCNSIENCIIYIYIFRKVALLEISTNSFSTGFTGLQFSAFNVIKK